MSGEETSLDDLLGPAPVGPEVLIDKAPPKSRPMGAASRGVLERSRSYPVNGSGPSPLDVRGPRAPRKNTPERLNRLLKNVAEIPHASDAAQRAGISLSQLKYWLQKSKEGAPGDGFDVALPDDEENENSDNTQRFHLAWDAAVDEGLGKAETASWALATGFFEVQSFRGRVQYKIDPDKYDLFVLLGDPIDDRNPRLWLRDENGAPVPETIFKQDPDMLRWYLENRKPKEYGKRAIVDMNVTGGVLVVGMRAATSEALNELESAYRREGRPAVTFDDSVEGTEDDTGDAA